MDDTQQLQREKKLLQVTALSDLATLLKSKGIPDEEVAKTIMDIVTQVELEVVSEMMVSLSEEEKVKLDEMVAQNKSGDEIAETLHFDEVKMQEIETRKFAEIIQELMPSLTS